MASIERIGEGVYSIFSLYSKASLHVSSQDLRDISDWCLLHLAAIEADVKRELAAQTPDIQPEICSGCGHPISEHPRGTGLRCDSWYTPGAGT